MPLRLDIKRRLTARSDRVKSVDLHPTEPWMLASLYNGSVCVWNHETQTLVKTFEVCDLPVRASKFVARKNWVITGADDMQIRVFNYNTLERVHMFEAHSDYIRCIAVHPTQPYILTSSDDMLIKLWDWEKKWSCSQVFEGHTHYVMQIVINPKLPGSGIFGAARLDWNHVSIGLLMRYHYGRILKECKQFTAAHNDDSSGNAVPLSTLNRAREGRPPKTNKPDKKQPGAT